MASDARAFARIVVDGAEPPLATAAIATTLIDRVVGLLSRRGLDGGEGLVLPRCGSIHTWFMRFAIDVVFVDGDGRATRTFERLGPFRLASGGSAARTAIELPAGTLRQRGVRAGMLLRIEPGR